MRRQRPRIVRTAAAAAVALATAAGTGVGLAPPAAADAVIKVTNSNDSGPGSYRDAINIANTNGDAQPDVIRFDDDVHTVLTSGNVAYTGTQPLTLDGNGASISGSDQWQILLAVAPVTVDELTIQHGSSAIGGGISVVGSLVIRDSQLSRNNAQIGGGISVVGPVTISASEFSNNGAQIGGAMSAIGSVKISDSEFSRNDAFIGGAVTAIGSAAISHSEFTSNHADGGAGGAVAVAGTPGSADVEDSLFEENTASAGGAIAVSSDITVTASAASAVEVSPSAASAAGATLDVAAAPAAVVPSATLDGVTIAEGSATVGGGVSGGTSTAVFNGAVTITGAASLKAVNSTFTDNTASQAGGVISVPFGDVTLTYVTSSHNGAPTGAQVQSTSLSTFGTEYGSATSGANCAVGTTTSDGYNLSTDESCALDEDGDDEDAGDPRLDELADNGGPTPTRLPHEGSKLIDAIPDDDCQNGSAAGVDEDQRGVKRPQDDRCDIGAVEVGEAPVPPAPPVVVVEPTFTG